MHAQILGNMPSLWNSSSSYLYKEESSCPESSLIRLTAGHAAHDSFKGVSAECFQAAEVNCEGVDSWRLSIHYAPCSQVASRSILSDTTLCLPQVVC